MNTTDIRADQSLAELASIHPGAAPTFLRQKLDFCCHGRTTLAEACQVHGLDPEDLVREIQAYTASRDEFDRWDEKTLDELIDHILVRFHERHRADLPPLIEMARKVEARHQDKPTCPQGLTAFLAFLQDELEQHMQKEEQILFPMIRAGQGSRAHMPIQVMEQEHKDHGQNLARLRQLTGDLEPPAEACTTWRALYVGLADLESELMLHIHLENNILFPRALRS
ncbi:MAG: iron-sulfur cluster repair protein YtfE [Planctomycetota bacterium]